MTAYDYEKQEWLHGREGAQVRLEQLEEELALLTGPRAAEYRAFKGVTENQAATVVETCRRGIAECEREIDEAYRAELAKLDAEVCEQFALRTYADAAIAILKARGIEAGWEWQPGYIDVTLPVKGHSLACGTVNGPWATQHCTEDGDFHDDGLNLELPTTCTPLELADMLTREYVHQVGKMWKDLRNVLKDLPALQREAQTLASKTSGSVAEWAAIHGWVEQDTGGHCTALQRNFEKHFALITCIDDPSAPEKMDSLCALGFYTHEQEHSEPLVQFTCPDVLTAFRMAARLNSEAS